MAVTDVRIGAIKGPISGGRKGPLQRQYVITYCVITDDAEDGAQVVLDAPGLPTDYTPYQYGNDVDTPALLRNKTATRDSGDPLVWWVEATFDTETEVQNADPTLEPPDISWSTVSYSRVATHDIWGTPILNTAKDEFDPPASVDEGRLQLTISRNEAAFQIPLSFSYINAINSDPFYGFAPGTAKVVSVASAEERQGTLIFYRTTYVIQFRNLIVNPGCHVWDAKNNAEVFVIYPWNLTLANVGFHEVHGLNPNQTIHIRHDGDRSKVVQPMRLDKDGVALRPFTKPRSDSWFVTYAIFPAKPFSLLGLP